MARGKKKKFRTRRESPEPTIPGFDRPLLYRLSYEASREQAVGDYGGNCGNATVKDTNECCTATTKEKVLVRNWEIALARPFSCEGAQDFVFLGQNVRINDKLVNV